MPRILKGLLVVLFFLAPPTVASAQTLESFIRIQRDEKKEPVALQTSIVKYVPASSQGVEVDLVAVVHIGDRGYYETLNEVFKKYDVVLYELVAPEGTKPSVGGGQKSDNPLAMLQSLMKLVLRLEHQLEVVDYHKANFVHADLSAEGIRKAMRDRGEDEMTVIFKIFAEMMQKMREDASKPKQQAPVFSLEDFLNAAKVKRLFAEQLVQAGGFGQTIDQLLIGDRNKAALKVLDQQLKAGKKRIAIFYGAAHMPDFDKRLGEDFGMKRTTTAWVDAWSLAAGSDDPVKRLEDLLRQFLK